MNAIFFIVILKFAYILVCSYKIGENNSFLVTYDRSFNLSFNFYIRPLYFFDVTIKNSLMYLFFFRDILQLAVKDRTRDNIETENKYIYE